MSPSWQYMATLLVLFHALESNSCPYNTLPPYVQHVSLWDRVMCINTTVPCVVKSSTCQVVGTPNSIHWEAIGSYIGVPSYQPYMRFAGDGSRVNVELAVFPNHVTELYFSNMLLDFPSNYQWPDNLQSLTIENSNLATLPQLPHTIEFLFVGANSLSNITELRSLPPTIQKISLENNDFTHLTNLDWRNMTKVYLLRNSRLTSISHVQFSSSIRHLNLENLSIRRWIMDNATFFALNSTLHPNNTVDDSTYENGKLFNGYNYYGLTIDTDPIECATHNGAIYELWPDKSNRNFRRCSEIFNVCVVKDAVELPIALTNPEHTRDAFDSEDIFDLEEIVSLVVGVSFFLLLMSWWTKNSHAEYLEVRAPTYQNFSDEHTSPRVFMSDCSSTTVHRPAWLKPANLDALSSIRLDSKYVLMPAYAPKLGNGAFAIVRRGSYQGQAVAIKYLQGDHISPRGIQLFANEIKLMSTLDSPYIVKLLGACWTSPSDLKCVMELMDHGDLRTYLECHTPQSFPWRQKYLHIQSLIDGLVYLHSRNIIHRDIKSRNILLDSMKGIKLTDFGISKQVFQETMTMGIGTFRWMAPEVLQDQNYTIAADIYSFGAILSEFSTHRVPYHELRRQSTGEPLMDSAIVIRVIQNKMTPRFSPDCPNWIHEIALQCLAHRPSDRPTAKELSFLLRNHNETTNGDDLSHDLII